MKHILARIIRGTVGTSLAFGLLVASSGVAAAASPPTIASISPPSGTFPGGTPVTIAGTNFAKGATVTIGGTPATSVQVKDASTITATTPAGDPGVRTVVVTNADGQAATLGQSSQCPTCGFDYTAPITITGHVLNGSSPVSGVFVSPFCYDGPCQVDEPNRSGADGSYTMYAMPARYGLGVYMPNPAQVNSTTGVYVDAATQTNITANIPVTTANMQIAGTVTDYCTGSPINNAGIYLTVPIQNSPTTTASSLAGLAFTDSSGHFAVSVASPATYSADVFTGSQPYGHDGFTNAQFTGVGGTATFNFKLRPNTGCAPASSSGGSSPSPSSSGSSSPSATTPVNSPSTPVPGATPASGTGTLSAAGGSVTIGNLLLSLPAGDTPGSVNIAVTAHPQLPFPGGGDASFSPNGTTLAIKITNATTGAPITTFTPPLTLTFQLTPADLAMASGNTASLTLLQQIDANTPPGENPDHLPVGSYIMVPGKVCTVDAPVNQMTCALNFLSPTLAVAAQHTAFVQNFVANAPLWSGWDAKAFRLGTAAQFTTFLVAEPQVSGRLLVYDYRAGNYAWIDATDVGPSGPPAKH